MASFNSLTIIGNLTRDIEVRHIANGTAVATVTLAINEKWTAKDGAKHETVTFVDCTLWGRTAELAAEYLLKGAPVLFSGRLKQEKWVDKETNQNRTKLGMTVEVMQFLGGKDAAAKDPARASQQPQQQSHDDTPF